MSVSAGFSGLEEFFDYKNQLLDDLMTNSTVVDLLADGDGLSAEQMMYERVFPYECVPDVTQHGHTFLCCEVDIREVVNKTYLEPAIYIWVFTHESLMRLPQGGVRVDKLASEIAKAINGSRMYGLGELDLYSVKRFSPCSNYQGRSMTFYTKDYNRLSPSRHRVPSNRKVGG